MRREVLVPAARMQVYYEIRLTRDLALYICGQSLRLAAVCVTREFAVQVAAVAREHIVAALDKPVVIERVYYRYLAAHVFRIYALCQLLRRLYAHVFAAVHARAYHYFRAGLRAAYRGFGVFQRRTRNVYNVPYLFCLRLIVHAYHPPVRGKPAFCLQLNYTHIRQANQVK